MSEVTLEDLASLTVGYAFKSSEFVEPSEGIRLVRCDNIGHGSLRWDGAKAWGSTNAEIVKTYSLEAGDVVVAMDRPWIASGLKRAVIRNSDLPCLLVQRVARLRGKPGTDQGFIQALVESQDFIDYILSVQTGTTVPHISGRQILSFQVRRLPALAEQQAIAGVLGALDDKIESNRRLVRTLEQLGRAELAIALAGPNGETWEFAWPETQLGDVLSLIETGDRPKGGVSEIAHGVPSVGAESIVAPGVFDFSKTKFVPEEYFAGMRRGVLESGDVLLYKDGGTPGNFIPKVSMCQDGFPFEVAALNSHVYRLRVEAPYSQAFLYFWLSSQRLLDEMWLRGTGAAIPSLNSTNVKGLPFPMVPEDSLAPVLPVVDELMARLHRAAREQRTLELLRDALLPELLSGRLRVRDVEGVLEGAV